jgi:hypothetical protein
MATLVEPVVPGVGVCLELAAKVGEPRRGPVAFVCGGGVEDHLLAERIHIGPEAALEAPAPVAEHRDARVVGLQIAGGNDLTAELLADGASAVATSATQSHSVVRERSIPSRAKMPTSRCNGR